MPHGVNSSRAAKSVLSVPSVVDAAKHGVAGGTTIVQSIMVFLSVVIPLLKAVKTFQGLLPANPFAKSTLAEPRVHREAVVHARRLPAWLWWVAYIACVPALKLGEVRFPLIGRYMWMFRQRTGLRLPDWVDQWPVRTVASWFLLASLGKWAADLVAWKRFSPIGAKWTTVFIQRTLKASALTSSQQRQVFVDVPLVVAEKQVNHTHGAAARDRNAGSATSALAARMLGLEPYFVQQSLADVRKARAGDRSFHWAKDLAIPPREFSFDPSTHAAVLVDVDHYVDMPWLLATKPGTYFVCTFQPTASAESVGEYTYRFLPDGKVAYRVSGGAEYVHEIWDYSGDTLLVEGRGFVQKTVVAYHIDRKRLDAHHVIVLLSQIGQFTVPAFLPTSLFLEGNTLKRFNPVQGDHIVIDVVTQAGLLRSVAITGDYNAVTLPRAQFDAVRAVSLVAKVPITPAMVASNIAPSSPAGLPTERMAPGHAAIVASFIRAGLPKFVPAVYPPSESVITVMFDKHDYSAPVPLAGLGSPLVGPCYGFASSIASDDRCIAGRVEAFHSFEEKPISPTMAGYMQEFVERLIPVAHRGHPVSDDEVRSRQDRPSQRAELDEASVTGDRGKKGVSAFVKKETYQKVTDPRNISTYTPATKLKYSRFVYAFSDEVMSQQPWYAFNMTPAECAERVCQVLLHARWSVLADGNRFDGHVRRCARVLERMCALRFFAPEHHSALNEAMDEQFAQPGSTEHSRKYRQDYDRGSGSLETANFNSIDTSFIGYCGHRNTTVNGVKRTPDEAWAALGVYGGDDSLEGEIDPAALKKSAAIFGQDYEITVVNRGDIGVEFLNRQFGPNVWNGDRNSMANPSRLLSKLWVGPARLLEGPKAKQQTLQRLGERLSGYYRMDRNSPVIGPITEVAHELLGDYVDGELMPWDGRHSIEVNWPNEDETGWMDDLFNKFIPDFDAERFAGWITAMRVAQNPELLLQAPLCTSAGAVEPIAVKQPCIVGDSLELPKPKEPEDDGAGIGGDLEEPLRRRRSESHEAPLEEATREVQEALLAACKTQGIDEVVVGADGSCVSVMFKQADDAVIKPAQRQDAAKTATSRTKPPGAEFSKKPKATAKGASHVDPRDWKRPALRPNETKKAFEERSLKWERDRTYAAKKLGVVLTDAPAKGGAPKR